MPPALLRILLAENNELFRLGLRIRLQQETGLEVVAEALDSKTAVESACQHPLDIVLLDLGLPGIGGIEACRQIKQQQPNLPVLVLTSRSQKSLVARLIEVGAQGYCLKAVATETLVLALRSVAAGASWWCSTATREIHATMKSYLNLVDKSQEKDRLLNPLTHREQEILALIIFGKTNLEIASLLCIALSTVKVHVHAILHKLDVHTRTEAASIGIQKQLISTELLAVVACKYNRPRCK